MSKSTRPEHERPARDGAGFSLRLLADGRTLALLGALRDGPLERSDLALRLGVSRRTLDRRLDTLVEIEIVVRRPSPRNRRRVDCALSEGGGELFLLAEEIGAVWRRTPAAARRISSAQLLELIADRRNRLILRALLSAPQPYTELLHLLPGLTPGALQRHLETLLAGGLVRSARGPGGAPVYRLNTSPAPALARIAVLIARWRWRWTPHSAPRMAGDLAGLIELIAPFAHTPPGLRGTCHLRVQPPPDVRGWPDVELSLADGHIRVLVFDPARAPDAQAQALPLAWCEALLSSEPAGIEIDGEREIVEALLAAVAAALRA